MPRPPTTMHARLSSLAAQMDKTAIALNHAGFVYLAGALHDFVGEMRVELDAHSEALRAAPARSDKGHRKVGA